jgi:hypothetical protein
MLEARRICVAGIETETKAHLRPVTDRDQPLTRDLLATEGGPFELGAVIELGDMVPRPTPPHVEDRRFRLAVAERIRRLSEDEYLGLIDEVSFDEVGEAFGPALQRRKWKYAVDLDQGECSLACVRTHDAPDIEIDRYGKPTFRFNDPEKPAYLRVTDLRLFQPDQRTPRPDVVEDVRGRLREGVRAWIVLGLSRPFLAKGDDAERSWLQVNGLCLEDSPLGAAP